jgi:acetyl esterase/lipase
MGRLTYLIAALTCAGVAGQAFANPETVSYKTVGDRELTLRVFKPEGWSAGDSRGAIVFFHGGGWRSGSPKQFFGEAEHLAKLGMVAFSAQYRLTSQDGVTPTMCISDAKSAMRFVRSHAAEFGIDPGRIAAGGGSAGGHLAAAVAMVPGFDEAGEDTSVSCVPNALALYNPVLDLREIPVGRDRGWGEDKSAASPIVHVHEGLPPTIVFHGTKDTTVPFGQAERFTAAMKAAGNQCVLVPYEGRSHGFFNASKSEEDNADTTRRLVKFLREHGFID